MCAYCKSAQFASVFLPRPQFSLIPFTQASTSNHDDDDDDDNDDDDDDDDDDVLAQAGHQYGDVRWSDALFSD